MKVCIRCILFLFLTYSHGDQFDLYNTDHNRSCLYGYLSMIGGVWSIVPYCFQSESIQVDLQCNNHGYPFTFTQLQTKNISTYDLYEWNAPMDIIDSYGKFDRHYDVDGTFCNCTDWQWFGPYCQFTFQSSKLHLSGIIEEQFRARESYQKTQIFTFTTYEGITCQPHGFGLDWRHICNGLIDCENGEDEIHCHLLEVNECDPEHEFRCKSGMCIDKSFAYDFVMDCLDRSDEIQVRPTVPCFFNPSMDCEEFHCASMNNYQYPCGDGECVSSSTDGSTSGICLNGRNKWYFTTYVNPTENFCQACLLCRLNKPCDIPPKPFIPTVKECQNLLSNNSCLTECNDFFLSNFSLFYPEVRLFYASAEDIVPRLICYNNHKCGLYPTNIQQSGLTCRNTTDFYNKKDCQGFAAFLPNIHRQFSACALPHQQTPLNTIPGLFQCPNSYRYLSFYSLNDGITDCPTSDSDEKYERNFCQLKLSSHFQCLTSGDCIARKYLHYINVTNPKNNIHCKDKSDQIFPLICEHRNDLGCHHRRGSKISVEYFLFQEICNGQIHAELLEDENDCDEWKRLCNLKYRRCDGVVNCFDQLDERNCYHENVVCGSDEVNTDCISYPDPLSKQRGCLPISWINNGKVECFGGIDEDMDYCARNYPNNITTRFHCFNDAKCIPLEDICDGIPDCPYHDDETICLIRMNNTQCPAGTYFCNERFGRIKCAPKYIRCDGSTTCYDYIGSLSPNRYHDEKLCNWIAKPIHYKIFSLNDHNQYPSLAIITQTIDNEQKVRIRRASNSDPTLNIYRCHRGIVVKSSTAGEQCLCPPSYYGETCQYQSERISIVLNIQSVSRQQSPENVYKLLIRLQTSSQMFFDHIELFYSTIYDDLSVYKQAIYLRAPPLRESYSVGIDIFQVSRTSVTYHSSLYYNISFPFLPVNRLATKVIIDDRVHPKIPCEKNCSMNGQCRVYLNNIKENFCLCRTGWSGEFCQIAELINCSSSSLLFHSHCICPLARFGRQCYAHIDFCHDPSSCRNGGVCVPLDPRLFRFVCICPTGFYGRYCDYRSARISITMNNMWLEDRSRTQIPVVIVHLANITSQIGLATIDHRYIFKNVKLGSSVIVYSKTDILPTFVFVQVYFDTESTAQYHLVALMKSRMPTVVTGILPSNRCPPVNEFLDTQIMSLPYMKRVKYYNRPCLVLGTRCFHDESYICLCDNNGFLDCVRFDHSASNCSTSDQLCLNGGHCYQPIQKTEKFQFACVCPRCYFGDQCQFTMTKYTISLDALLDQQIIIGKPLSEQLPVVRWTFALVVTVVIIGFIANGCSILTFTQRKPREMGCGWYLLVSCIVSQLGIIVFGARFVYLLQIRIDYLGVKSETFLSVGCISLEFLLAVLPAINDWLTACVTIERTMIATQGVTFNKRKSVYHAKFIITGVITINIVSALHEPFHRRLVIDSQYGTDLFWCVIDFPHQWINFYEITTNLFHLIVPFTINCISIFVLLISVVRRKVILSDVKTRSLLGILREQLTVYKASLLSSFIIILLELPRLVFSFAFSCVQVQWQKQLFLASYIISSLPMMLTLVIFVLPKKSYKNELIQLFKRMKRLTNKLIA